MQGSLLPITISAPTMSPTERTLSPTITTQSPVVNLNATITMEPTVSGNGNKTITRKDSAQSSPFNTVVYIIGGLMVFIFLLFITCCYCGYMLYCHKRIWNKEDEKERRIRIIFQSHTSHLSRLSLRRSQRNTPPMDPSELDNGIITLGFDLRQSTSTNETPKDNVSSSYSSNSTFERTKPYHSRVYQPSSFSMKSDKSLSSNNTLIEIPRQFSSLPFKPISKFVKSLPSFNENFAYPESSNVEFPQNLNDSFMKYTNIRNYYETNPAISNHGAIDSINIGNMNQFQRLESSYKKYSGLFRNSRNLSFRNNKLNNRDNNASLDNFYPSHV